MRYVEQRQAHDIALTALLNSMADMCEEDARRGIFHAQGRRCTYCHQRLPNGQCRLREMMLAAE